TDTKKVKAPEIDVERPRPQIAEFHVRGDEATVTFDVPLPDGDIDLVLTELLLHEAIEVVREKRHTLPIDMVTRVVALACRGGEARKVGVVDLPEPGILPPPATAPPSFQLGHIAYDPLEEEFSGEKPETIPTLADTKASDRLAPIGSELRLPRAVDLGLRAQGVDPDTMQSGDLVRSMLTMFGYRIAPGVMDDTFIAEKAGVRTFVRQIAHETGSYPELEGQSINQFVADFLGAKTDRALLVTDKFGPFEVYERERRDPRCRFITRERLQKFVDSMALE
ncbi:MAG: hypothetical protein OEX97_13925, partial [Acidimicrobiia bacterium]|nr:hypothetical protein [Acidimicrobiia bacterium]